MYGVCALTGVRGTFVKSHVIPRALTRIEPASNPFVLINGDQARPLLWWDSWIDRRLVTRAGEDILCDYDNWGIATLRRHHLIWSSWGAFVQVPPPHDQQDQNPFFGIRVFEDIDPTHWRLFFASLLWRAAATALPHFNEIIMPPADLEVLGRSLLTRTPLGDDFYPVALTQLSTRGQDHIRAPLKKEMLIFDDAGNPLGTTPIFRFYFDGLTAQFRIPGNLPLQPLGPSGVGNEARFAVVTVPFETSRQRMDLEQNLASARVRGLTTSSAIGLTNIQSRRGEADSYVGPVKMLAPMLPCFLPI
jgi:hypothetical protein